VSALDRFHASWPRGVSPTIVEHFAGGADLAVPAMTLWSGAERVAAELSSLGLEPGDRVGCALPPGVRWAQTFVACLMRRLVFAPVGPGQRPGALLRALIDESGVISRSAEHPRRVEGPAAVSLGARTWTLDALEALSAGFGQHHPRAGARLVCESPWWEPGGLVGAWLGLSAGCELHVGVTDDELHRLGPDLVCARPGRLSRVLDWAPSSPVGLAVIAGAALPADQAAADQKQWKLVSLALPA
jgi:hypothetical protein